jgi:hypothetical protein
MTSGTKSKAPVVVMEKGDRRGVAVIMRRAEMRYFAARRYWLIGFNMENHFEYALLFSLAAAI